MGEFEGFLFTMLAVIVLMTVIGSILDLFTPSPDEIRNRKIEKERKREKKNEARRAKKSK
jgi:hypothetical protein